MEDVKNGGVRPGAGRPKGTKGKNTLEKEAAREYVRERVTKQLRALIDAQVSNAKGLKYLVVRNKATGKFVRVAEKGARHVNADEEIIEVWEKDPSVQAFTDLMNRALDKPKEQEFTHTVTVASPELHAMWEALPEEVRAKIRGYKGGLPVDR